MYTPLALTCTSAQYSGPKDAKISDPHVSGV